MLKLFSKKAAVPTGPVEYLIVGLGNPGKEYENTRHNAGYMAVERIAQDLGVKIDRIKYKSLCADAMIGGKRVLLMKPSTFMNLSGQAVTEAARFYKIPMEKVIVFMDDISLEPGKVRIRRKGTDGGHNGIKNIIYQLQSDAFPRVRLGVGVKPHPDYDLADWVLAPFPKEAAETLSAAFDKICAGIELILKGDLNGAMQLCNGK